MTRSLKDAASCGAGEPSATRAVVVWKSGPLWQGASAEPMDAASQDLVAVEAPVALVFNGITHAVMMATPADLEDLALGFAVSEGLLDGPHECYGIEVAFHGEACEVQMEVSARAGQHMKTRRRTLAGRTGCGLCGVESLQQVDLHPPPVPAAPWLADFDPAALARAMESLPGRQPLNQQTGALHAAAWALPDGTLTLVMEDVGRHNALDKLLGRRLRDRDDRPGFVVVSSRASHELVRKCARLGVPLLAAISAPTSLAVDVAQRAGMRLYGFCRGPQAVRYGA